MNPGDLTSRVARDACVLGAALTAPAAWLGGLDGALGAVAGAAIAVGNFRWLASRVIAAAGGGSTERSAWTLGAVLRLAALAGAVALVLVSGHAHPVAIVAGLSVLPVVVVFHGLRDARAEV
jgi:nitrate reductase gamma subunit